MGATGTATIDFGAAPGSHEASTTFADTSVGASSRVDAFVMADGVTSDHTANDHRYAEQFFSLSGKPTAGVGGTIYATSIHHMQGAWAIIWVWAD